MGISCSIWNERKEAPAQVFIFAVEHIDTSGYREFVRVMISQGILRRVVFDEADTPARWDDFRPSMHKVQSLLECAPNPVQRVLISATIPPHERENVLVACGMRKAALYATTTSRRNLQFDITVTPTGRSLGGTKALCDTLSRSIREKMRFLMSNHCAKTRVMVFVMRVHDIELVEQEISHFIVRELGGSLFNYHGRQTAQKRLGTQQEWDSNGGNWPKVMVCTSAFGVGVDSQCVRLVYLFGGSPSLVQYAQECGRGGRTGERARCIVLWNDGFGRNQEQMLSNKILSATTLGNIREYH